ncbi:MAG: ATP-binding protein [Acidobacteriota bacterium]
MQFLDRLEEMARLDRLMRTREGGLAVVYGRRRLGKTRLLLEWGRKHGGLYTVADQSAADIQRRYFAEAVARKLSGFSEVEYRDWRSLLSRLAREALVSKWRGPIIFDELPYLVLSSPELPSVLQQWIDHEARKARLVVAVAGSSQRMVQGLVLSGEAPLYGRAREILEIRPLDPDCLGDVFGRGSRVVLVENYASWGGVPRYWELACDEVGIPRLRIDSVVLNPLAPLHREPDRLLIEELPSAMEVRPVLDAIGAGAHRVSEIGGRIGRPATSISRPLERLVAMGLVRREVPFGEPEKKTRRSLYKIDDPFFRLWFRVVAPHRGVLASSSRRGRVDLLNRYWDALVAQAWEDLCRRKVPDAERSTILGKLGPWGPASRWWKGTMPEWDVVSESADGKRLLLGEAKWSRRPLGEAALAREARALASKALPVLPRKYADREAHRALFVPELTPGVAREKAGVLIVTCSDIVK